MPKKLLTAMTLAAVLGVAVLAVAAKTLNVQIRDAKLRENPSFLSKPVGDVVYGSQVEVAEEKGDWAKVGLPGGVSGWLHLSALTDKKLSLSSGGPDAAASVSGKEMALAGKGFNSQVEAAYRRGHAGGYEWVDRMGKITYQPEAMLAFLKQGEVYPREGGAK